MLDSNNLYYYNLLKLHFSFIKANHFNGFRKFLFVYRRLNETGTHSGFKDIPPLMMRACNEKEKITKKKSFDLDSVALEHVTL